jgi:hypothetical protein
LQADDLNDSDQKSGVQGIKLEHFMWSITSLRGLFSETDSSSVTTPPRGNGVLDMIDADIISFPLSSYRNQKQLH